MLTDEKQFIWHCSVWYAMLNKVQFCYQTTGTKNKCIEQVYQSDQP